MSFIQCKSEKDVEETLERMNLSSAFVTEDHRIYDSMTLSDDACFYKFDAEMAMALYDLQTNIEMIGGRSGFETGFTELVSSAKLAEDSYKKVAALLKQKPVKCGAI